MTAIAIPAGGARSLPAVNGGVDRAIRVSTAAVVLAVAGIAAYISYWHAYAVVREYGETGVTAGLERGTAPVPGPPSGPLDARARHPRLARRECGPGLVPRSRRRGRRGLARGQP